MSSRTTSPKTLTDDMILTRRGALSAGIGASTALLVSPLARAQSAAPRRDSDARDPPELPRGPVRGAHSNLTDRDKTAEGAEPADSARNGRGGPEHRRPQVSDRDRGENEDPSGNGRGPSRMMLTGVTDEDPGTLTSPTDAPNNGRNPLRR